MNESDLDSLNSGEFILPEAVPFELYQEHIARYAFACNFSKGKFVLDIACGTGYGTDYLANNGAHKVYGGDFSKRALGFAKRNENRDVGFFQLNGEQLPFTNDSFDIVCSFETVEHVNDPFKFVSECRRVLKQGGLFICSTPNKTLTSPLKISPVNPYHQREFSMRELHELLDREFSRIHIMGQDFYKFTHALWLAMKFAGLQLLAHLPKGREFIEWGIIRNINSHKTNLHIEYSESDCERMGKRGAWEISPICNTSILKYPRYLIAVSR